MTASSGGFEYKEGCGVLMEGCLGGGVVDEGGEGA